MPRLPLACALVASLASGSCDPLGAKAQRTSVYRSIDHCLAAKRAWNYRTNRCDPMPAGPVDYLYVKKSGHWLAAYRQGRIIREFRVALGRGGLAAKQRQGDARVPEGLYRISAHNPVSHYHLSLRIDYPTPEQAATAAQYGYNAGGDIMIHGLPNDRSGAGSRHTKYDWTDGCVALTDPEVEWLFANVPVGTPIEIRR